MTSVEDRTRAAIDAITRQVDTTPPPPLQLPPLAAAARRGRGRPSRRRWGSWLAPAAAAAAMIAVAVTLVAVRNGPAGRPALPAAAAPVSGVPEYYLAIPGYNTNGEGQLIGLPPGVSHAVVGDTFTGKRVASVPAPAGWKFISVTAAGDDRTFVVGAYKPAPQRFRPWSATNWFLIHLTPGPAPSATLRELPIRTPSLPAYPASMALSPDGTEFALAGSPAPAHGSIWVYSTGTGALLHTWSNAATVPGLLSWTSGGHQLALQVTTDGPGQGQERVSIRLLPADDPGHDLLADSRVIWSMTIPANSNHDARRPFGCGGALSTRDVTSAPAYPSILVSGDGTTLLCGASGVFRDPGQVSDNTCPAIPPWNYQGILKYSTATGKPAGPLYRRQSSCVPGVNPVWLLWTSGSGDAALGYLQSNQSDTYGRFGLFKAGKFTPLPAPPTNATDLAGTVW
jgi:hypothetical protein